MQDRVIEFVRPDGSVFAQVRDLQTALYHARTWPFDMRIGKVMYPYWSCDGMRCRVAIEDFFSEKQVKTAHHA